MQKLEETFRNEMLYIYLVILLLLYAFIVMF